MKKKPNRKLIVKKLDKAVSEFVRKRDKVCVVCGSDYKLGCGHIFTRKNYSTRWDLENCWCQCWSCNYRHTFSQYEYFKWFIDKFGQDKFDKLYLKHKQFRKFTTPDLQELLEEINGKRTND